MVFSTKRVVAAGLISIGCSLVSRASEFAPLMEKYSRAEDAARTLFVSGPVGEAIWLENGHPTVYPALFPSKKATEGTVTFYFQTSYVDDYPPQTLMIGGVFALKVDWRENAKKCYLTLPGWSAPIDRAFCHRFHHVLYTWSPSGTRLYLDGERVAEGKSFVADTTDGRSVISARQGLALDEFAVLTRSVTEDEARAIAAEKRPGTLKSEAAFYAGFDNSLQATAALRRDGNAVRVFSHIGRTSGTFLANDKPAFSFFFYNPTATDKTLTFRGTVRDLARKEVLARETPVSAKSGALTTSFFDMTGLKGGLYWGAFETLENGVAIDSERVPFAVSAGVAAADCRPEDMTTGFYYAYPFHAPSAQKWVSSWREARWESIQPEENEWYFDHLDRTIDAYVKAKQVPTIILGASAPEWYVKRYPSKGSYYGYFFPDADNAEGMTKWLGFVRTLAERYKGKVFGFEFFPEYYGRSDAEAYAKVFNATAEAIHSVDPTLKVASTYGGYEAWRKAVVPRIARNADYYTMHPYEMSHATLTGDEYYESYRELLKAAGANPVFGGTETGCWQALQYAVDAEGYPLTSAEFDKRVQSEKMPEFYTTRGRNCYVDFYTGAFRIVRQQAVCLSLGFIYNEWWSDCGGGMIADVSYASHTPSLMSLAYAGFSGLMAGYRFERRLDWGETGLRGYLFKNDAGKRQLLAMTDSETETGHVFPRVEGATLEILDIYGNPVPMERQGETVKLTLRPLNVLYIRNIDRIDADAPPTFSVTTPKEALPGEEIELTIAVNNPLASSMKGQLTVSLPKAFAALAPVELAPAPNALAKRAFRVKVPENITTRQEIVAALKTDASFVGEIRAKAELPVRPAVIAARDVVTFDGDLTEWGPTEAFPGKINRDDQIIKGIPHTKRYMMDQRVDWFGENDLSAGFAVRHDDKYIYVAVRGYDDKLMNQYIDEPIYLYLGDSVELFIDGRGGDKQGSPEFVGDGVYHLKLSPRIDNQAPAHYVSKPRGKTIPGLEVASKQLRDGYAMEVKIPKAAFPGFSFGPGNTAGFMVQINDLDSAETSAQAGCKSVLNWTGDREISHNPAGFGKIVFK